MLIDLTLMGIDNLTTVAQVEAWLSSHIGDLPYFDYTQGTLIPFNGTGLKTVGFNQWDEETKLGYYQRSTGRYFYADNQLCSVNMVKVFPNTEYYAKNIETVIFFDCNSNYIRVEIIDSTKLFTTPNDCCYIELNLGSPYGTTYNNDACVNISDAEKNGTYEPYQSNTLSLPTLTYFPSGMKSAGSVYDELSDKAYTRIGSVDLGSLDWEYTSGGYFRVLNMPNFKAYAQSKCSIYPTYNTSVSNAPDKSLIVDNIGRNRIYIKDSAYTDATALKQMLTNQNAKLYYELETPTEFDISLDLTYPIQWGGTEQILPVNTSTPTTSGIVADIKYPDGIRYDQTFVYRVIEKTTQLGNRALSIMLGKKVETDNPEEPLEILLKGEK